MAITLILSILPSPVGPLDVACDAEGVLRGVSFGDGLGRAMRREYPAATMIDGETPEPVREGLEAYFSGDQAALGRIPWSLEGATAADGFQARVWWALADIPAGLTISYGEMARRAGEPGAAQAAGVALNRNPIPVVLPCHRVVGADGAMVGFGGGLERKTWLLRHEGALLL
jgi:methylated-DNA-[protein]-cysteine S-methyltransferase